jgi:hypothetical protein
MRRALKILAWVTGILVGIVLIAGGALYAYVSSEHFRTRVAQYLGD